MVSFFYVFRSIFQISYPDRSKESIQARGCVEYFIVKSCSPLVQPPRRMSTPCRLSATAKYICSYPPYLERVTTIRNPRGRHATVTGTHINIVSSYFQVKITNSMEQSHSATQEFPPFNGTRRFITVFTRDRHWSFRILSPTHPIHNFPLCFPKNHSSIILPSTPTSYEWSLPFMFPEQNFVCISHLSHACYMSRPSHPPWLDHPNSI